jgi:hypothetical protein
VVCFSLLQVLDRRKAGIIFFPPLDSAAQFASVKHLAVAAAKTQKLEQLKKIAMLNTYNFAFNSEAI